MESAQRDMLAVLLKRVFERGLISEAAYRSARNTLASSACLPELLRYPVCPAKETMTDGGTENPG